MLLRDTGGGTPALPTWAQVRPLPDGMEPFELAHTDRFALFCPHPLHGGQVPERAGLRYYPLHIFRSLPYAEAGLLVSCLASVGLVRAQPLLRALRPSARARRRGARPALRGLRAGGVPGHRPGGDRSHHPRGQHSAGAQRAQHLPPLLADLRLCGGGRTLEHAVRREVMEEVGLRLGALRYLGDQPWGVSGRRCSPFRPRR